jgi:phospho-N-acetylmuramoyl-pentapeptide-transferase
MSELLGILLLSFFITVVLMVPFIDFLFKIHMHRTQEDKRTTMVDNKAASITAKLLAYKGKKPQGGGVLIVLVTIILSLWAAGLLGYTERKAELFILIFTMFSFGLLGFYDDLKKNFTLPQLGIFQLRARHKMVVQVILGLIIGSFFYFYLGFNFIHIHWFGILPIGPLFIPLAAFAIVAFANAYNITDGLDGLSTGTLFIALTAFTILASQLLHPSLALFTAVWLGALVAFLYFNIFPARIELGDTGALAFGATLAVVGLLTGKIFALVIIGGVFIVEVASSLFQMISKKYRGQKLFIVSPLHLWFMYRGWEEPKVVTRFWIAAILFAIFGLWLGVIN